MLNDVLNDAKKASQPSSLFEGFCRRLDEARPKALTALLELDHSGIETSFTWDNPSFDSIEMEL